LRKEVAAKLQRGGKELVFEKKGEGGFSERRGFSIGGIPWRVTVARGENVS